VPQVAAEGSAGGSPTPPSVTSRPTSARPLSGSAAGNASINLPRGSVSGSGPLPGRPLSASGRPQSASLLGPGRILGTSCN
jgi:hypothetical protein